MPAVNSTRPVKYRNHCPTPTLSNISTIAGAPASLEPPATMKASAVTTERVQRVMRRPLPEAAGSWLDIVIRMFLRKCYRCRFGNSKPLPRLPQLFGALCREESYGVVSGESQEIAHERAMRLPRRRA